MENPRKNLELPPALTALTAVVVLEIAARSLLPVDPAARISATGVLRAVEAMGLVWWMSRLDNGLSAIGLGRGTTRAGIQTGLIWSAAFVVLAAAAAGVLGYGLKIDPVPLIRAEIPPGIAAGGLFFLAAGIASPITEEIFFRGILYSVFRKWGAAVAILGSTVLFTAAHDSNGFLVVQCIGGVVFAVARERSGSLLAPITIHILGNLAIFSLSIIAG